jgi:hypothetical protein
MPRSRKNKKGILEVGFFIEIKNRHIIHRLPVAPSCWPGTLAHPLSSQNRTEQGRQKTRKFQGQGTLGLPETTHS